MQNRRKIIFIGGVGKPEQFGGELTKNKNIIKRLRACGYNVCVIDTFKCSHSFIRLISVVLRFLYNIIFCHRATFVFSSSLGNVYSMLKIMYYIPIKYRIIYWGIGGAFSAKIRAGVFDRKYLAPLHKIIVEGNKMKQELADAGLHNVSVMPNFKTIQSLPDIKKYDDGKIHFLFISRIMPQKGADYILQCARHLNESGFEDRYIIDFYGTIDGEYSVSYGEQLAKLPNVDYCGSIDLRNWSNFGVLARYHFMLFPTYWHGEGFPGVVIDAYIAGVPIIASDWNFNEEFVANGRTGIIIPAHSVEDLYRAMAEVIDGRYDIAAMSSACRERLPMYDVDNVLSEEVFKEIL